MITTTFILSIIRLSALALKPGRTQYMTQDNNIIIRTRQVRHSDRTYILYYIYLDCINKFTFLPIFVKNNFHPQHPARSLREDPTNDNIYMIMTCVISMIIPARPQRHTGLCRTGVFI